MDLRFLRKYLVSSKKYRIFASRNKKIKIMVLLVKFTDVDDSDSTIFADVMVCSSKDSAKEIILNIINKDFDEKWKNLCEAAEELSKDLYECKYSEDKDDDYVFLWHDNGKGEKYNIVRINEREVNTKFQSIGEI